MLRLMWIYYAPGEVAGAVEHIDLLVERGATPEVAVEDAARIYRQRTGDHRTPCLRGHLLTQWRVRRRGGPGCRSGPQAVGTPGGWSPRPSKYPTEVSLRAFCHRLFHE
jgi:hypothetical protein